MSEATKRTALAAPALPRENFKPIKECRNLEELFSSSDFRERITASVPRHMTDDRILSVVLRAHMTNRLLLEASPTSFAGACLTATNTGLEPNSALHEAHLIPFKIKGKVQIQVIFGYQGLLKLSHNTGRLLSVSANVVYPDADVFDWMEGTDTYLKFKRGGRRGRRPDDQPGYAFFHARLVGGGESMEVWPYGDVLRVRNLSQAFRYAKKVYDEAVAGGRRPPDTWTEAPWVKHEEPMARKTMIRAGTKYLPKSVELALATRLDELQDRRTIDYGRVIDLAGNAEHPDYAETAARLGESGGQDDDETSGGEAGGRGDPGGAFTDRRDSAPNDVSRETEQPRFEHYLIDDAGEYDGPYVDPVQWANAFLALRGRVSDMPTFLENNEQALLDARRAPVADQLLAVRDEARDLPGISTLTVTERGGKPNWPDYVNGFRHVLFGWRGNIADWLEAQRANVERAPLASRLLLLKAARERAQQLGTALPDWVVSLAGPAPRGAHEADSGRTAEDGDARWAEETIGSIEGMASSRDVEDAVRGQAVQTRMARLKRERPELWDKVDRAVAARIEELDGGPPNAA